MILYILLVLRPAVASVREFLTWDAHEVQLRYRNDFSDEFFSMDDGGS